MRKAIYQRSSKSARQLLKDEAREQSAIQVLDRMSTPEGAAQVDELERKVVQRRQQIKNNVLAFIWYYVKIESGDPGSPVIPFRLWADQAGVLKALLLQKLIIILKARQLGITWLVLSYALWKLLTIAGFSAVGISRTEDEAKELIRRLVVILKNLPLWLTREASQAEPGWYGPVWEASTMLLVIKHPNGLESRFVAEQSSANSGRSFTSMLVILDEWAFQQYAREIWQAVGPTMNRKHSGQVIGLSTAELNTLFEEKFMEALAGTSDFYPIFLPWWSDPSRDAEWYEKTKREWPNTFAHEYPSSVAEAFSQGGKRFFPEWNPKLHTFESDERIPRNWRKNVRSYTFADNNVVAQELWRYRGMDWGFNAPFCVLWGAVDYDGCIWIYRELYESGYTGMQVAERIKEIEEELEDETVHMGPADTQIGQRIGTTGPTVEEEFARAGILWEKADKATRAGWQQIHSRLLNQERDRRDRDKQDQDKREDKLVDKPMLMISKACPKLIGEFERAHQDKNIPDQISKTTVRHGLDACFAAGTQILTSQGEIPIEHVRAGDRVWTRNGYKRVLLAGKTANSAMVFTVELSNGRTLTGTGNHPVFTQNRGWVPLDSLQYSDMLVGCPNDLSLYPASSTFGTEGKSIDDTLTQRTGRIGSTFAEVIGGYTGWFGKQVTGLFQRGFMFTTGTVIPRITNWKILSVFQRLTTTGIMQKIGSPCPLNNWRIWPRSDLLQLNGTEVPKVERGIRGMGWNHGRIGRLNPLVVRCAGQIIQPSFRTEVRIAPINVDPWPVDVPVQMMNNVRVFAEPFSWSINTVDSCRVQLNAARRLDLNLGGIDSSRKIQQPLRTHANDGTRVWTTKNESATAVNPLWLTNTQKLSPVLSNAVWLRNIYPAGSTTVYNLTVEEDTPEYFANGVLVHNCRYMCMYRPFTPKRPKQRIARFEAYRQPKKKGTWRSWCKEVSLIPLFGVYTRWSNFKTREGSLHRKMVVA